MVHKGCTHILEMESYNIIVANGILPRTRKITNLIEHADHVIVCDGAINTYFTYTKRLPNYVIGDGDSLKKSILGKWKIPFIHVGDQETNDLTKAVLSAKERGWDNLIIIGATGGREDHSLANIFLLGHYLDLGVNVKMVCTKGDFVAARGRFDENVGRYRVVSLFPIDREEITASGLKYPVRGRTFDELWQGSLNVTDSDQLTIDSQGRYIIFLGKRPGKMALEEADKALQDYNEQGS